MAKILAIENGKAKPLEQIRFTEEARLQDYLEQYPELIPVEDIDENAPPLFCIGREVGVSSGSEDLLFVDKSGLLTVVETKLAKNREARRTVVGQILEYASYTFQWTSDEVYDIANAYLALDRVPLIYRGCTLDEAMMKLNDDNFSPDNFRENIDNNLRNGKIRLIIAVDELVEQLRTTVDFVNSNSRFDLLLLQVKTFRESETKEILIPSLFGQKVKPPERHYWTEEAFLNEVDKRGTDIARPAMALLEFAKREGKVRFGTGTVTGSFTFGERKLGLTIFTVYTDGKLGFNLGWMVSWQRVKNKEELFEAFAAELNQIPGINPLPEGAFVQIGYDALPHQTVEFLAQGDNLDKFKDSVLSLCERIEVEV